MLRRRLSDARIVNAAKTVIERLEGRTMLTTLHGGDVLEFLDPNDNIIRVSMNGSGTDTADLIGATVDQTQTPILHDFSGTLNGQPIRGGIGGRLGVQVIGATGGDIRALASNAAGLTYGFTITTPPTPPGGGSVSRIVQLVQINNGTGAIIGTTNITDDLPTDPNSGDGDPAGDDTILSTVTAITAADFDPLNNNIIYFVTADTTPALNAGGDDGGGTETAVFSRLWTVDVTNGTVTPIAGAFGTDAIELNGDPVENREISITSITFNSAGQLYAYYTGSVGDGDDAETAGFIAQISRTNNPGRPGGVRVTLDGDDVTTITGIEFLPVDTALTGSVPGFPVIDGGGDGFIFAVTTGDASTGDAGNDDDDDAGGDVDSTARLLHIQLSSGLATSFGGLDAIGGGESGHNLGGIAFNPTLSNPFYDGPGTAPLGVLLGTDTETNQLVFIDTRARYENTTLWQVYVTSSTSATNINVALVPPVGAGERPMQPFTGDVTLRVTPTEGDLTLVNSNSGSTGSALLGAVTRDLSDDDDDDLRPLLSGTLDLQSGAAPAGVYTPGFTVIDGNDFGRFQFGGTVTGIVDVGGSLDLFYAGWLVTGATAGQGKSAPTVANNFNVDGNLGALLVLDSIGTEEVNDGAPIYNSGVDVEVGGELGHMKSGESVLANVQVRNEDVETDLTAPIIDFETRFGAVGPSFEAGRLIADFAFNDTLDSPTYLRTIGEDNVNGYVQVVGLYEADPETLVPEVGDVFGVGLMSGQTYTVQLQNLGDKYVNVYDPDGRLVASNAQHGGRNNTSPFRFTADRPGTYKFEVKNILEVVFIENYTLTIRGVGNVALGGIAAVTDIFNGGAQVGGSYGVAQGDLGTMFAGEAIVSGGAGSFVLISGPDFTAFDEVLVSAGNVRSIDAAQIGLTASAGLTLHGLNIEATTGSVGLVRSRTGVTSVLVAAGVDLQLVDSAGAAYVQANVGGAIGVVRAGDLSSTDPSRFRANADNVGFDGVIGLIESAADFGSLGGGGPQIGTGQGGNVRYLRAPGIVYQDRLFAGGAPQDGRGFTLFDPAQTTEVTDDSGVRMRFSPLGVRTPNPLFDPNNIDPANPVTEFLGPQVQLITYGIRFSGGVVVMAAGIVGGDSSVGLRIESVSGDGRPVEVSQIDMQAQGSATGFTDNADGLPTLPNATGTTRTRRAKGPLQLDANGLAIREDNGRAPLGVNDDGTVGTAGTIAPVTIRGFGTDTTPVVIEIIGSSPVDVLDILGGTSITRISNTTGGEIVNVTATSIGEIVSSGSIGLSKSVAGTVVAPAAIRTTLFPFEGQRIGINAVAGIISIRSARAIGNVFVDRISEIVANSDGSNDDAVFEGIVGPVSATTNIGFVQIGEGLAPSGSGTVAQSGLFADGIIFQVANQNTGSSNIYGDIISGTRIGSITLTNGSIINSDIAVSGTRQGASNDQGAIITLITNPGGITSRIPLLGTIDISGKGGIIGSNIRISDLGELNVDGFGIFTSIIDGLALGRFGEISAAGYGIRNTSISSGGLLEGLIARGNGENIPVTDYGRSVRYSETEPLDPFFGVNFDPIIGIANGVLNDLNANLGTTIATPIIDGVTDSGVIENVSANGAGTLVLVSAYQIRERSLSNQPVQAEAFTSEFQFAGRINEIRTKSLIDGLAITTGRLDRFRPGSDVYRFVGTVSGRIGSIRIDGTFGNNSSFNAIGPNAQISSVYIDGDLDGTIRATSRIGTITVTGQITGQIIIDDQNGGTNIKTLTALGGVGANNLTINGSIGRIIIGDNQAFAGVGSTLTVNGNLGGVEIRGGVLDSNIIVSGNLGTVSVKGTLAGDITVGGNLSKVSVANSSNEDTDSIIGDISVAGNIGTVSVKGGNVSGSITAGGTFKSFTQTKGNIGHFDVISGTVLAAGNTLSVGEKFSTFKTTGNLLGNISAGVFGNVTIGGNLGDGTTPITSTSAGDWTLLKVIGSIRSGSTTSIANTLGNLDVDGDIDAGAVVAASAIARKRIDGQVLGVVTP